MMSQIHCKQSIRIEKSGWFKHYFPGNLRRNNLFKVCNYTSYQNLQKTSLPNPFAREKAGDKAGTVGGQGKKRGTRQALTFTVFSGLHAQTQCLPCPPLFHGRTGWAERFFVGFGNWYSYKP